MFEEQLDFKKETNEEKDNNYFIFNQQKPDLENNYFDDLQAAKIQNKINNEFKQQSQEKPLIEQLEFLNQPNIPVFPTEKPNPLFYNKQIEQNQQKKIFKKEFNKRKIKSTKTKTKKKPKKINNYNKYNQNYKKRFDNFNQIDTSINYKNKGLFDPTLKLNELDYPMHTQKQRIEKIQKIKNYDVKYGNKLKNLEMYQNFLDAYNDQENEKNDFDLKKQKFHPTKEMIKNRKDFYNLIRNIPKPKKINYNKINLDFNFNKYENVIQALEKQIEQERKLRNEVNFKYLEKMKEFEDLKIKKMTHNQNVPKRAKTAIKIYYPNKNNSINYTKKPNTKFMQKIDKLKNKVNNIIKKTEHAPTKDEIIKQNAKNLAEEITKNLDKDINKKIIDVENKKREIINKQLNKLKNENNLNNNNNNNNSPSKKINKNNFISIQNNNNNLIPFYPNNNFIVLPSNSIETQIANEVFNSNDFTNKLQKMDNMNKFQLLSEINKTIDNYNKGFPQLLKKVNETIEKINSTNVLDKNNLLHQNHPLIEMASKNAGQIIQLHTNELTELIIDDLLFECVKDLQKIEDLNNEKEDKKNFINNLNLLYNDFKTMKQMENDVFNQIDIKNPLKPYTKFEDLNKKKENVNNNEIINPFDENYSQKNLQLKQNKYKIEMHPNVANISLKYSKDFYDYMKSKGSFYFPNIFGIYDEVVKQLCEEILNENVNYCVEQTNEMIENMFKEELINANKNK